MNSECKVNKNGTDAEPSITTRCFESLFEQSDAIITIDKTYQRGFVWDDGKIRQLLADLKEFKGQKDNQSDGNVIPDYYMGAIILYENTGNYTKEYNVIDGQQRLSALAILYYVLNNGNLPEKFEIKYDDESAERLRRAYDIFTGSNSDQEENRSDKNNLGKDIFRHIHFTVITVRDYDQAFSFFETQNNRGLRPAPTDMLKSFHLRAIKGDDNDVYREISAKRWEGLQNIGNTGDSENTEDFAPKLFEKYLWRARRWVGHAKFETEAREKILEEFEVSQEDDQGSNNVIPIYPCRGNMLWEKLNIFKNDSIELILKNSLELDSKPENIPFSLRQPISAGLGFFLFSEKYAAIYRRLFIDDWQEIKDLEEDHLKNLPAFRKFHDKVIGNDYWQLSPYLRDAFRLATIMYFDKFGYEKLFEFALWLDYSLNSIRIRKASVRKETVRNYFGEDRALNLLDVIAWAVSPDQVIDELRKDEKAHNTYTKNWNEGDFKGVRKTYKDNFLQYCKEFWEDDNKQNNRERSERSEWIKYIIEMTIKRQKNG